MQLKFFDSHAHLTDENVYRDIDEVLKRAKDAHIEKIVNICVDKKTLEKGLVLSRAFPWVYNAAATTPHDVEKEGELYFSYFEQIAKEKKLVAIGETGLDYYYEHSDKKTQQKFFIKYLHLAQETKLPVIIHCRDAFDDLYAITDQEYEKGQPLLLHCFTGNMDDAQRALERHFMISISGIVTFKKSENLRSIVEEIPLNRLFIETDTPYLAPQSKRGNLNEPAYIVETTEMLAKIKGISLKEMASITFKNALNFFGLENGL